MASRSRSTALLAALVIGVMTATTSGAQATNAPEMRGRFLTRPAVAIESVRDRCLELGDDSYEKDVPQVGTCAARGVTALGNAGGRRWYSAVFGRRWLLVDSVRARADTVAESEVVLFSADRNARLTPVWHYRFEPEMLRSVTPEVVQTSDGSVLVAIDECVNGTGGCSQSFLLFRGGRGRVVRLSFVDSLNRRYPGAINHGYHVDIRTMRADAAVYSPDDANCCPSRVAEMKLRLHDDALEIIELRTRPPAP